MSRQGTLKSSSDKNINYELALWLLTQQYSETMCLMDTQMFPILLECRFQSSKTESCLNKPLVFLDYGIWEIQVTKILWFMI